MREWKAGSGPIPVSSLGPQICKSGPDHWLAQKCSSVIFWRIEVKRASRCLSAIAELLVSRTLQLHCKVRILS